MNVHLSRLNPVAASPAIPPERLAANKTLSEAEKVAEASRQFEALLLRQILGQARKTIFSSKFNQDSMAAGIYRDLATERLAEAISQNGGFGLARSLEAQLLRQTDSSPKADHESKPGAGGAVTKPTHR